MCKAYCQGWGRHLVCVCGAALLLGAAFSLDDAARSFFSLPHDHWLKAVMEGVSYLGKGWRLMLLAAGLLGFGVLLNKKLREAGELGLYALMASGFVVQVAKHLIGRARPALVDQGMSHWAPLFTGGIYGFDSLPSGHATLSFALAVVLSQVHPRGRALFYAGASVIAVSRLSVGAHFLSDVVAGVLLGILIGRMVSIYAPRILPLTARIAEKKKEHVAGGMVVLLAGLLFFYQLGSIGLFDVDEAVFAEATREMMDTGNLLTPLYNYEDRYDKPILFYWLIASAFALFGINEFAARFWSAGAGCALVLATFLFARTLTTLRSAVFSALILVTSLEMLVLAHAAITDMVLTFFITVSLYCFFLALHEPALPRQAGWAAGGWAYAGWAAAAGAVLTKGPIGLLFPLGITVLFLWATGRVAEGRRLLKAGPGVLLFFALTVPWYLAESVVTQGEFLRAFFLKHNVARYLSVNSGHQGPVFYYFVVIALGFFPWSVFLPTSLWSAWRLRKNALPAFLLLWICVIFIFFSLSRTKLPNYVAPLFPPLCLLLGWWWDRFLSGEEQGRGVRVASVCGIVASLLLAAAFAALPFAFTMLQSRLSSVPFLAGPLNLGETPVLLAGAAALIAGGFFLVHRRERERQGFGVLIVSMVLFSFVLFEGLFPKVGRYIQEPLHLLARSAIGQLDPQAPLVVLGLNHPSILFYARRPAVIIGGSDVAALRRHLNQPSRLFILTKASLAEKFKDEPGFYPLERRGGYVLVSNQPLKGR